MFDNHFGRPGSCKSSAMAQARPILDGVTDTLLQNPIRHLATKRILVLANVGAGLAVGARLLRQRFGVDLCGRESLQALLLRLWSYQIKTLKGKDDDDVQALLGMLTQGPYLAWS